MDTLKPVPCVDLFPLTLFANEADEIKQYAILLRDTQTQP